MTFEDIFYKSQNQEIIPLQEGDEAVSAFADDHPSNLAIYTAKGYLLIFERNQVRVTGAEAKGVEAIDLDEGDEVKGGFILNSEDYILVITEKGYMKLVLKDEFPVKKRAQKGLMAVKLNKDDKVSVMIGVNIGDELILSTETGKVLRFEVDDKKIPIAKRTAMGDRLLNEKVIKAIKSKI